MIKTIMMILLPIALISCSINPPSMEVPEHRKPASSASVVYLRDNTTINNESNLAQLRDRLKGSRYFYSTSDNRFVWDLNGGILDGRHQMGDGGQSEDQEPLFRCNIPLLVRNGFIRNNKDAMMFNVPNCGVQNLTWLTVGEDAISTHRNARNFTVRNCEFINHRKGDKSIQLNNGEGAHLENNMVFSGRTAVRLFSSINSLNSKATSKNNMFIGNDTAWNIEYGTLTSENDKYKKVRLPVKLVNGARINRK